MPFPIGKHIELALLYEIQKSGGKVQTTEYRLFFRVGSHLSQMTDEDYKRAQPDGRNAWRNTVHGARSRLVSVGELESVDVAGQGNWVITEQGRARLQREWPLDPEPDTEGPVDPISPNSIEFLADDLTLNIDFLEGIANLLDDKRQVIFQGPPGTGKTYVARELAKFLAGSDDRVWLVQFHPSYSYEDFVQGYRPKTTDDGKAGFTLRDGPLLRAAEAARQDEDKGIKHFLIIDEINRGNLASVFGELYFLLEYRDEEINLQYSSEDGDGTFSLPDNLYIIGTMNTADRSIALVDLALRRRFYFVEFHPDDEPIKGLLRRWLNKNGLSGMEWVADVVDGANQLLTDDRHAAIGPSYFMKDDLNDARVELIWEHSVLPYIEERLFGQDDRMRQFKLDALRQEVAQREEGQPDGGEDTAPVSQDDNASE